MLLYNVSMSLTCKSGVVFSPQTILYNHSHSGVCRCAVAAEFFGHASHKTLWSVEYLCPMNTFLFYNVLQYLLSYLACLIALQHDVASGKFNLQWTSMHDFEMNRNQSPQVVKMAGSNSDLNLFFVSFRLGNRLGRKDCTFLR